MRFLFAVLLIVAFAPACLAADAVDYTSRLDEIIFYLKVNASCLGLLVGLMLWRLVLISKNIRDV